MKKISDTQANNLLRAETLERLITFFTAENEEVLKTAAGEICFPVVDENGEDKFVQVVVKIPKGSRDGEPFDGYGLADDFTLKRVEKEEKAKKAAAKKAAKVKRDEEMRRKKKENAEKAKEGK